MLPEQLDEAAVTAEQQPRRADPEGGGIFRGDLGAHGAVAVLMVRQGDLAEIVRLGKGAGAAIAGLLARGAQAGGGWRAGWLGHGHEATARLCTVQPRRWAIVTPPL